MPYQNENSPSSVSLPNSLQASHRAPKNAARPHTLASMSSVAAAADAPEEFAALADDVVDDFMSAPSILVVAKPIYVSAARPLIGGPAVGRAMPPTPPASTKLIVLPNSSLS